MCDYDGRSPTTAAGDVTVNVALLPTSPGTSPAPTRQSSGLLATATDDEFVVGQKQLRSSMKKEGKEKKGAKSVSFHSASTTSNERKVVTTTDCMHHMMTGSSLIKIKSNIRHYHRFFSLNDEITAIRWVPSTKKSKNAQLPIDSIREIRTGKTTEVLRNKEVSGNLNDDCCFSIIYGDSFYSLDLVASTPEEANIWVTGLNALINMSKSKDGLEERQSIRDRWLKEMFQEADISSSGCLDQEEAIALIKKLNNHVNTGRVHKKIMEFDHEKTSGVRGRIDSSEFIDMFKEISTRPEIYFLMIRYSCKDYFTLEDLQLFLEGEQGMMDLNAERCREIILEHEPTAEARVSDQLLIDGFSRYLQSKECDIFDPCHSELCQDMTQPLTHYFISSSHNTYLLEDQLQGPSSVDGFIKALQKGCRCVKVDIWDGRGGPVVYHGNTFTSRIPFKDVAQSVYENAFTVSQYPVIIHMEIHCCISNQRKVVAILKEVMCSTLFIPPCSDKVSISELSPEKLRRKILISGKKLASEENEGFVSDEDDDSDTTTSPKIYKDARKQYKLCKELSDIVSIARTSFLDLKSHRSKENIYESFSIKESNAARMSHIFSDDFVNNNKNFLTRVHPNGSRIDSSNFNPQDFWNCGCQMVAMNFQTQGLMMDLHDGKFKQNGGCGYVLKPRVMTEPISYFSAHSKDVIPGISPQVLRVKIISAQQLPRPIGSTAKGDGIDPYVNVQIFGIPADCFESRTKTVSNQGNCPIFEESFEFSINLPDLALVRFVVLDDDFIGDDFIGQYTIPLECIRSGYRHVPLLSGSRQELDNSSLFVHISITNKRGGGKNIKKSSKKRRIHSEFRTTSIKTIDDSFKAVEPVLSESNRIRVELDRAMADLRVECGLPETSNIKQCLRVIINRLFISQDVAAVKLVDEHGFPTFKVDGSLNAYLCKLIFLFERVIMEYRCVLGNSDKLIDSLTKASNSILSFHENINYLCIESALKGRKYNKALENFAWNITILRGQLDLMQAYKKDCTQSLAQVQNSSETIENMIERDRSPTQRPMIRIMNPESGSNNNGPALHKQLQSLGSPTLHVSAPSKSEPSKSLSQPSINTTADDEPVDNCLKPHASLSSTVSCPLQSTKSNETWI